jgi:hypothetical protein
MLLYSWWGFFFCFLSFSFLLLFLFLLSGVTSKRSFLMRHSWARWAQGPEETDIKNGLQDTWPPSNFSPDRVVLLAPRNSAGFSSGGQLSHWAEKKPLFPVTQWFLVICKHSPHTTAKGGQGKWIHRTFVQLLGLDFPFLSRSSKFQACGIILYIVGLEDRESIKEKDYVLRRISQGQ